MPPSPHTRTLNADWLWPVTPTDDIINVWAQFRHCFELGEVPAVCLVRVTADRAYRLYVNGRRVGFGPVRGFAASWHYDTIDIASFLHVGENVIAALAHNPGIGSHQYIHSGFAGFLLEGHCGAVDFSTSADWKSRRPPDWRRFQHRLSIQLGWQETVDGRLADGDWLSVDYDDGHWPSRGHWSVRPCGSAPWHDPQPSDIPPLREILIRPSHIVGRGLAANSQMGLLDANIAAGFRREAEALAPTDEPFPEEGLRVPALGESEAFHLVMALPQEVFATLLLDINGAAGGEHIDMLVCEGVEAGHAIVRDNEGCQMATAHRYVCRSGDQSHETFWPLGGCYLAIAVRGPTPGIRLRLSVRHREYPFEVRGFLETPRSRAAEIHHLCLHTQQLCSSDTYVDCPGREQAMWWGDAVTHFANSTSFCADDRLLVRGIRLMERQRLPNGLTYAHAPTKAHECVIPDFTLAWVRSFADHHDFTGDPILAARYRDSIFWALGYFHEQCHTNGMLWFDKRYWLFLDWARTFKDGASTLYNLEYLETLQRIAPVFRAAGFEDSAGEIDGRAARLRTIIEEALWNRETDEPLDGLAWDGTARPQTTLHTLVRCLRCGIRPDRHEDWARRHLLPFLAGNRPRGATLYAASSRPADVGALTPYFLHFAFEALDGLGYRAEIVDCILRWWGDMLDRGLRTTEEVWDAEPGVASRCHAWSAHPVVHLPRILLGVRRLSPGWTEIGFDPLLSEAVGPVCGAIDTPHGPITVDLRDQGRDLAECIQTPANVRVVI